MMFVWPKNGQWKTNENGGLCGRQEIISPWSSRNYNFSLLLKHKYELEVLNRLKLTRGKLHNVLGMDLDFSKPRKVTVGMKYVEDMIEDFQWI